MGHLNLQCFILFLCQIILKGQLFNFCKTSYVFCSSLSCFCVYYKVMLKSSSPPAGNSVWENQCPPWKYQVFYAFKWNTMNFFSKNFKKFLYDPTCILLLEKPWRWWLLYGSCLTICKISFSYEILVWWAVPTGCWCWWTWPKDHYEFSIIRLCVFLISPLCFMWFIWGEAKGSETRWERCCV